MAGRSIVVRRPTAPFHPTGKRDQVRPPGGNGAERFHTQQDARILGVVACPLPRASHLRPFPSGVSL